MRLYKLTNKIDSFYIIADHPTEAQDELEKLLDEANYGFTDDRKVNIIELIANEIGEFAGKSFLSDGSRLIIVKKKRGNQ